MLRGNYAFVFGICVSKVCPHCVPKDGCYIPFRLQTRAQKEANREDAQAKVRSLLLCPRWAVRPSCHSLQTSTYLWRPSAFLLRPFPPALCLSRRSTNHRAVPGTPRSQPRHPGESEPGVPITTASAQSLPFPEHEREFGCFRKLPPLLGSSGHSLGTWGGLHFLQMKNLKLREGKSFAQGHTASGQET